MRAVNLRMKQGKEKLCVRTLKMCVRAVQICNTKILYEVKDMVIAQ